VKKRFIIVLFTFLLFTAGVKGQEIWRRDSKQTTPSLAIKTNILYDATMSINLGAEFKVGRRWTLEIPATYNPWALRADYKWKLLLAQPELRWWPCEPFNGHFFGLHGHYAFYNIAGVGSEWMRNYRFEGWLAGGGITYGYQFYLGPRWNLELSIGAGYTNLEYDRSECILCGDFKGRETMGFIGPTKAALTLIYIIK
jgi:hypothetical protein